MPKKREHFPARVGRPKAWGYGRESHINNSHGDSGPAQLARVTETFARKFSAEYDWGSWEEDKECSAFSIPFFKRPAGAKLLSCMMRGDVLIVDKINRLWRSVGDFVKLTARLDKRGIRVVFVDSELDTSTAMGRLTLTIMVAVAEFESQAKSEVIRQAKQRSEAAGVIQGGRGWMLGVLMKPVPHPLKANKKTWAVVWWPECRAVMDRVVQLRDVFKYDWYDIGQTVERDLQEIHAKEGIAINQTYRGNDNSSDRCKRVHAIPRPFKGAHARLYYIREKEYRLYGITDPRDMNRVDHPKLKLEQAELVTAPMPEMKQWQKPPKTT
jgi:DNA invertase Pin-like site-specific DNA recombinase